MSYISRSLGEGERLVATAHFHWTYQAGALLSLLLLGWLIVGIFIFLHMTIRYNFTEIGVTSHRIIKKVGLFTLRTEEIALQNVEGVRIYQNFWGRVLGFGRMDIEGTGVNKVSLPTIADPIAFRRAIETAKGARAPAKGG